MKRTNHGRVLAARAANAVRVGRVPDARALMARAHALAPGDPDVLKRLADIALVLNDLPTAR
jgi:Flp pilus assembly protein TadD